MSTHKHQFSLLLSICFFALPTCSSTTPVDREKDNNSEIFANKQNLPSPITCAKNEDFSFFTLGSVNWLRFSDKKNADGSREDIGRDIFRKFFDVVELWDPSNPEAVSLVDNYKFEFCIGAGDSVNLKRVLHGSEKKGVEIIEITSKAKLTGLKELVFGDSNGVDIEIPLQTGEVLRAKEFVPQNPEPGEVAIMIGIGKANNDGRLLPRDTIVSVGSVQSVADPFGPCVTFNRNGVFLEQTMNLGSASIKASMCARSVNDDSLDYDIVKVVIQDSNPRLSERERAPQTFEGTQLEKAWKEVLTHHRTCDNFVFKSA